MLDRCRANPLQLWVAAAIGLRIFTCGGKPAAVTVEPWLFEFMIK
jgi:hypothetical protein